MQAGDITFLGDRWGKAGLVQIQHAVISSVVSGSTTMPIDDTIPQATEGVEALTCSITPKSASNLLLIIGKVAFHYSSGSGAPGAVALFQDSGADAIAASMSSGRLDLGYLPPTIITHKMTAGTVLETTYKLRFGSPLAGTSYINTYHGTATRGFGGVSATTLTIFEYAQ